MSEFSLDQLNEMYLDVLKEIGNIGAGNATTAIASILGSKLDMKVPAVLFMDASKITDSICPEEEPIVGVFLEICDDISGSMMFLLKVDSAEYLVTKLMGTDHEPGTPFSEMEMSAMQEIGNIIAGSYLSALSNLFNLRISPSVPYISIDMAAAILSVPAVLFGQYGDNALMIETQFGDDVLLEGYFVLMPDQESYPKILSALGLPIE